VNAVLSFGELAGAMLGSLAAGGGLGYWWNIEGSRLRDVFVHETTLADAKKGQLYRRRVTKDGRPFLLSDGEMRFYWALLDAVGEEFYVVWKLRVADIITPTGRNWNRGYGAAVAKQHVDFVVCTRTARGTPTSYPVCCIELDDKSHEQPHRKRRDKMIDAVFQSAELPLLRFQARHPRARYEVEGLRLAILSAANRVKAPKVDAVAEFEQDLLEERTMRRG